MPKRSLKIDIVTLFPDMFKGPLGESIVRIAREKELVKIGLHNIRDYAEKRRVCDDKPYGGGPGMVMKAEPVFKAVESLKKRKKNVRVILLCAQGKIFTQKEAARLSKARHLIFICGHYEGVDERVRKYLVDEELSLGDFILTGGELPAMCIVDAVTRLIPGVVGNKDSVKLESFEKGVFDYPHYTRPAVFRGYKVPEVLVSGNHKKVKEWREREALKATKKKRPDLLKKR